jgi:hypothetical protein
MLDDRKDGAMSTRPRLYGGLLALLVFVACFLVMGATRAGGDRA